MWNVFEALKEILGLLKTVVELVKPLLEILKSLKSRKRPSDGRSNKSLKKKK
jgi:hypothetical protein